MLNVLSGFLTSLAGWCEGCACHEDDLLEMQSYYKRAKATRGQDGTTCCYKGRRAPELAAGYLDYHVECLASAAVTEILGFCENLSSEEQVEILNDWNAAVDKTLFELTLKTEHWKMLPWSIAVIGHHDIDKARAGLRKCRDQFRTTDSQTEHVRFVMFCQCYFFQGSTQLKIFCLKVINKVIINN